MSNGGSTVISPDSSFSNLSVNHNRAIEDDVLSNDSLCDDDLRIKNPQLIDSVESNLDALVDHEVISDREFYRDSRNDDSSEQFLSPEMRPIGGASLNYLNSSGVNSVHRLKQSQEIPNASTLSALTSNNASVCDDANIDVDIGDTSDENFAVEDRMFHKTAVKDSAKLIENLKIENFNLKLRIYYFEQESSLSDRELRTQNVNLHIERDELQEKISQKEKLLNDAKKVIGSLSKDDSFLRNEKAGFDNELEKLKQKYEKSLDTLRRELGHKNDEVLKLRAMVPPSLSSSGNRDPKASSPSRIPRSSDKVCHKCRGSPGKDSKALEQKLENAEKVLELKSRELENKCRMMSAYEEKLARIEAEHLSCSDTEAVAKATVESQLRLALEEKDQLKRSLRSKERDWATAQDQIETLQNTLNDKAQQLQQLQADLRNAESVKVNLESLVDSGRQKLEKTSREKRELEDRVAVLENTMKEGVNHSVIYKKWKEEVQSMHEKMDELASTLKTKSVELEQCLKEKTRLEELLETSEAKLRENNYEKKKLAEEKNALQKSIDDAEKKATEQKYSINSLLKDNSKAAMEKEDLKEQIQDLKNDLDRSSRSLNEAEAKNRQLLHEKGSQGENMAKLKNEVANLQTKLSSLEDSFKEKDSLIRTAEEEIRELKRKLKHEEESKASLNRELTSLKDKEYSLEIEKLRSELNQTKLEIRDKDRALEDLESLKEALSRNLNTLETEQSCLKLDLDKKNEEVGRLKNCILNHEVKIADLEAELKAKGALMNSASQDLANKEHLVNSTMTELSLLKTQVESFKSQLLSSERRVQELESSETELEKLVEEKQKALEVVQLESRKDSESVDKQLNENNRELQFAYDKVTQLERTQRENKALLEKSKKELQDKEKAWESVQSNLESELEIRKLELESLTKDVEELNAAIAEKDGIIENLKLKKSEIDRNLETKSKRLVTECDNLRKEVANLDHLKSKAESEALSKDKELCSLLSKISDTKQEIDKLQQENANIRSENETLLSKNAVLIKEELNLKKANNKLGRDKAELEKAQADISRDKANLQKRNEQLSRDYEQLEKTNSELSNDADNLERRNRQLSSENATLADELAKSKSEFESLKSQNDEEVKVRESHDSTDEFRPEFKREKTMFPPGETCNSSLFDNYQTTSEELKKLLIESNADLERSKRRSDDLEREVEKLKQQILASEEIFDDMQNKLDLEKRRCEELRADVLNQDWQKKKAETYEEYSQTEDLPGADYSQLYSHLSRLAAMSSSDSLNGTEASLSDILALVQKITSKLQKYKSENKSKERQVDELKSRIEELVRANDSSCNHSETASTVSSAVDVVQYSKNKSRKLSEGPMSAMHANFCSNCGRPNGEVGDGKRNNDDAKRQNKQSSDVKKLERELKSKREELDSVKLQFEQYKVGATQKRADLSETVAQLKFQLRKLDNEAGLRKSQDETKSGDLDGVIGSQQQQGNQCSIEGYRKMVEKLEGMVKKSEVDVKKKEGVIKALEEGCKEMEVTFSSTVTSLQDLLQTKDKAVQGLCDQITKLKDQNVALRRQFARGVDNSGLDFDDGLAEEKAISGDKQKHSGAEMDAEDVLKNSQEELQRRIEAMQIEHENQCRDLHGKLLEAEQSVEKLSSVLSTRQRELNQLGAENTRYKERIDALEQQMKSTSHTIENVLQASNSAATHSRGDIQRFDTTGKQVGFNHSEERGDGGSLNLLKKQVGVQVAKNEKNSSCQTNSETTGRNMVSCYTQTEDPKGGNQRELEIGIDDPVIKQLITSTENYRLQLLEAKADYKSLNERFVAMQSVLSLQAEKIRAQAEKLKAQRLLKETDDCNSKSSTSSSKVMTHRLGAFELGNQSPQPRTSKSPPPRGLVQRENIRAPEASSSNPLAKSNSSEHDTSRHSLSREATSNRGLNLSAVGKSSSMLDLRRHSGSSPDRQNQYRSDGRIGNASVPERNSDLSSEQFDPEGTRPFEDEKVESETEESDRSLTRRRGDGENVHMPNIGDLMFEMQRLTKLFKSHDSHTLKLLDDIRNKAQAVGHANSDVAKSPAVVASNLQVNTSDHILTPPTKDTDIIYASKENDGKEAMRELMRLSFSSGLLSSHQSLIARIQNQFSADTNLIDSLKRDLDKQTEENRELKHCLSHLTSASKHLEECLDQSLQIVQCALADTLQETLPEETYVELKRSLTYLSDQKNLLKKFHSSSNTGKNVGHQTSSDQFQIHNGEDETESTLHFNVGGGDPLEKMCEQNGTKMAALMSDNKRLVEILERKDAEIDYLLSLKKSHSDPPPSSSERTNCSSRYASEHQDASERVCMLTDKLTKLLDENKQLKSCIRALDKDPPQKAKHLLSGYDSGLVIGTTFTLFHQLRDQISDARILAKTASVRLKDRLECGPVNVFSPSGRSSGDVPLLNSLSRDVSSVAKILEVCQNFLLRFKRVYFDQYRHSSSSILDASSTLASGHLQVKAGQMGDLDFDISTSKLRNKEQHTLNGQQLFTAAKNRAKVSSTRYNAYSSTTGVK